MSAEPLHYIWTEEDGRGRPDKVLATALDLSRTQLQRWMEEGYVTIDGVPVGARDRIEEGSEILVEPPPPVPDQIEPEEIPLNILHEDEDIIVLNKDAGRVVHVGAGHRTGTLVAGLLHHCKGELSGIGGVERPGIVHRLDRETSGVLVVAKNDRAHVDISNQFKDRETGKWYQAWVVSGPRDMMGTWDGSIARHRTQRQKMAVVHEGGRESRTDYKVLERCGRTTRLELRLHTGRTHQIRVHAATAGCPVVGDSVYGRSHAWVKEWGVERQLLHAWRLELSHPRTQERMKFEAELPDDFVKFGEKATLG